MRKRLVDGCWIAFSMYSRIPVPRCDWTEESMKYVMCFFPWIGLVIGALSVAWYLFAGWLGLGAPLRTVGLMLLPLAVTGGIHLDGMLDTADALSSWRPREKRIEILKDSHAGAFAILTCAAYFFLLYGVDDMLRKEMLPVYALGFAVSRSLSGFSVVTFPKMKKEGTVADFAKKAQTRRIQTVLLLYLAALLLGMLWLHPLYGLTAFAGALLTFFWYYRMAMKQFGGINGDLAGWFLSVSELVMPLCIVAADRVAALVH